MTWKAMFCSSRENICMNHCECSASWNVRAGCSGTHAQAAAICKAYRPQGRGPIIVADYADNPGGGTYGDSTNLLKAMLDAGLQNACFGPMVDAQTVQQLQGHAPGDTVRIEMLDAAGNSIFGAIEQRIEKS